MALGPPGGAGAAGQGLGGSGVRVLMVGDVFGRPGRDALAAVLGPLRRRQAVDLVVVNGENAAAGAGITPRLVDQFWALGVDVITSGNHVWDRREILPLMAQERRLLRPLNYPEGTPGQGMVVVEAGPQRVPVAVINLAGRVYFPVQLDDPFRTAERALEQLHGRVKVVLVDFHAEVTSEKVALGWYLDGRVSAVVGTHTHVQTADERILPGGTAYLTDLGLTGPQDGVIGVRREIILEKFLTQRPHRFEPAEGPWQFCAALVEVDEHTGKARGIRRYFLREGEEGPSEA
jgi:metallophosphoesterase (TIGR00282 family)